MNVRFLGAHNMESKETGPMSLLIDNIVVIDAGGLTSSLTFSEQAAIKALLITHHHYDHIKDIPMLRTNFYVNNARLPIYSIKSVCEALNYLFKYPGKLYLDFLKSPSDNSTLKFIPVVPFNPLP